MATSTIIEVVSALNTHLPVLFESTKTVIYLIGFTMGGAGVWTIIAASNPRNGGRATVGGGIAAVILGAMFLSLGAVLDAISLSTFDVGSRQVLTYAAPSGLGQLKDLMKFVVYAAALVGLFGVVSGGFDIKQASTGRDDNLFRGITKVFAGVAAINLDVTAHYLGNSFGATVSSIVNKLI